MAGNNGIPEYDDFDDYGYGDIPWADPAIRTEYEAALGRLILAHNAVDVHLTRLIERCLNKLSNPPELAKLKTGPFAQRLDNLRMLNAISSDLRLQALAFEELAFLNTERNVVAHGHFEQEPHSGEYWLIGNKKTYDDYSTERLNRITERLDKQAAHLRPLVAFYDVAILPPTMAAGNDEGGRKASLFAAP